MVLRQKKEEKGGKSRKRKLAARIVAIAVVVAVIVSVVPAYATGTGDGESEGVWDKIWEFLGGLGKAQLGVTDDEEEEGDGSDPDTYWTKWDEDSIDDVWSVYTSTNWKEDFEQDFTISDTSGVAYADVPDEFRTAVEEYINDAISGSSKQSEHYEGEDGGVTSYKELMVAIAYELCYETYSLAWDGTSQTWRDGIFFETDEDGNEVESSYTRTDVCGINMWLYPSSENRVTTVEKSLRLLYERYLECEKAYNDYGIEGGSPFRKDGYLKAIVQGVLYGEEYLNPDNGYLTDGQYDQSKARQFWNDHKDEYEANGEELLFLAEGAHADFAEKVLENYVAIQITNAPVTKK